MATQHVETDARFRLRELHALFIQEFERNAHDNAVKLLRQIAEEARASGIYNDPDVPTTNVQVRLLYVRSMYDGARKFRNLARASALLNLMRIEEREVRA